MNDGSTTPEVLEVEDEIDMVVDTAMLYRVVVRVTVAVTVEG
jgi:hypothetical protein